MYPTTISAKSPALLRLLATALFLSALLLASPSPAAATDWGGNGNPAASCPGGYPVKSAAIYAQRGPLAGKVIGQLELRWSWACHGQWARVVLYGGMYSQSVTVQQEINVESKSAGSTDFVRPGTAGTSAWTPFIRLVNSGSSACAQAWLSSDFGTLNFHTVGARVCA